MEHERSARGQPPFVHTGHAPVHCRGALKKKAMCSVERRGLFLPETQSPVNKAFHAANQKKTARAKQDVIPLEAP